jgi:hypothetical protein
VSQTDPEAATDELYAGAPAEFVARRDDLARQARGAGERELATRIKALRRPSVGAWYLNTAARSGLTSLRELLHLGEELREAQSSGNFAGLRDLAARRGPLVARVINDLTAHLAQLGTTTTATGLDEVRTTLASALADPEVAEQLIRGRLDRPHVYSGFGELPSAPAVVEAEPASGPADAPPVDAPQVDNRAAIEAAERELRSAEADLDDAAHRREVGEVAVAGARDRVAALTAELGAAGEELRQAEAGLEAAGEAESSASDRVEQARAALQR